MHPHAPTCADPSGRAGGLRFRQMPAGELSGERTIHAEKVKPVTNIMGRVRRSSRKLAVPTTRIERLALVQPAVIGFAPGGVGLRVEECQKGVPPPAGN